MNMRSFLSIGKILAAAVLALMCAGCAKDDGRMDVIFDTDANNEIDDQHAIAYLLLNDDVFNTLGLTTNTTRNGGDIKLQTLEAKRVTALVGMPGTPIYEGADGSFEEILPEIDKKEFDGCSAVNFIIDQARKHSPKKPLTVIAVGKLTNVALALAKKPSIAKRIRLVWLGTNYPKPGEYNFDNDIPSVNYVLDTKVPFEITVVRPNDPSGTWAVNVAREYAHEHFTGLGPRVKEAVDGRHGGKFTCFGDYSVDLFDNVKELVRSLYDMSAVAIVKNPDWAETVTIPAPVFQDGEWVERPDNERKITIWQNFNRDAIVADFIATLSK